MKIFYLIILLPAWLLSSCGSNTQKEAQKEGTSKITEEASCYAWISGQDSIVLHFEVNENIVTGELNYNFFEKDDNSGRIEGILLGDTIVASYIFESEGLSSTREVVFLKNDDSYIEGFGEMEEKEGAMIFANRKTISFDSKNTLKAIDCSLDKEDCAGLMGYFWSEIEGTCLKARERGVRLNPVNGPGVVEKAAFIIFSEDQSKVELFLPGKKPVLMERKGEEGSHYWENDDLRLYPWKGYILKRGDELLYAGS